MDDLVQEAFLEIFRTLHGFRGEASLGTWVDRITVRVAYAYMRRPKSRAVALAVVPDAPSGAPDAEERTMSRDALRRLYELLDRLTPSQRVAWVLHVLEDRPVAEVASITESSVVATKVRLWRARLAIDGLARQDPTLRELVTNPPVTRGEE
jgi:RNA polymerase sigma-70 factor (ECF subfamily)